MNDVTILYIEIQSFVKIIDGLKQSLERKEQCLKEIHSDRSRISQELTQACYETGKIIQLTEQVSKLRYEVC